jgi:hypothetical protein
MVPIGLGFRALRGGSVVVGVAAGDDSDGDQPQVVLSSFLATAIEGDPLASGPYHVAAATERGARDKFPSERAAVVAEGRKRQDRAAAKGLDDIVRKLNDSGYAPIVGALLVNRAGWLIDDLNHCLSGPEHVRVAEGLAVRQAIRFALGERAIQVVEVDEKSLHEAASNAWHTSSADISARLNALGATVGRPWRKEQKLACLSAWFTFAALRSCPDANR